MIRFLLLADIHLSDGPPEQRADTYFDDIMAKLGEMAIVSSGLGVDATIIAGDLFHRKNPQHISHKLVRRLGAVLSQFDSPVLTVPGNHDYTGNLEALNRSPYGVLRELGVLTDVAARPQVFADGVGVEAKTIVQVTGHAYEPGEPKRMYAASLREDGEKGGIDMLQVHVCHGMLLPGTKSRPFEFTTIAEIEDDAAQVTICGHYHPGWPVQKRGGRLFFSPGSLARISTHEHDVTRAPQFGLLSVAKVEGRWKAGIKTRALKRVKPAAEVFALDAVKARAEREAELVKFEGSLSPTSLDTVAVDVLDAARALAAENELDAPVLEEVLSLLVEADE